MHFILPQANLELFKLLKPKEFSALYNPCWEGSELATPSPLNSVLCLLCKYTPWFRHSFYAWTTLDSLFCPLVLVTIGVNRFSSCTTLWYIALFTVSFFLSEILRIPDNSGKKFRDFSFFMICKKLKEMPTPRCKIHGKNFFKKMVKACWPWLDKENNNFKDL